jgi:hypothetical protein
MGTTAMTWQPIETAPKDGSTVILWFSDGSFLNIGRYRPRGAVRKHPHCGWVTAWDFDPFIKQPSHWMPLPEPPK